MHVVHLYMANYDFLADLTNLTPDDYYYSCPKALNVAIPALVIGHISTCRVGWLGWLSWDVFMGYYTIDRWCLLV